jgi:hypothetical protein
VAGKNLMVKTIYHNDTTMVNVAEIWIDYRNLSIIVES